MKETAPSARPLIVAWLGYGGLIPFLALAVLTCVDRGRAVLWHGYLVSYAAVILSFVGALHWGFAMMTGNVATSRRTGLFAWSIVPCLMAFAALLIQSTLCDILLVIGFILHYWQDVRLASIASLPAWYLPLRLRLTLVAVLCVAVGAMNIQHA
jgi:hypothetical protein